MTTTTITTRPVRQAAYELKRELILKTAAEHFFAKGYTRTRIDDIAASLEATTPFIYYHFASKLDLLKEICGRTSLIAAHLAEEALEPGDGGEDIAARFATFVRRFSLHVIEERQFLAILIVDGKHLPAEVLAAMRDDRRRFHVALGRLLEEGRAAGLLRYADLSVANQTVTGMITWLFNWYSPDGRHTPGEVAAMMEGMVMGALGAPPARQESADGAARVLSG